MATKTNKKINLPSNKRKTIEDHVIEFGEQFKDAVFNHEECKKIFDEQIKAVKLHVSENSKKVITAFMYVLPTLSDNALNLSDVEGEYEQLINIVTENITFGNNPSFYDQHPGIFILMVNQIRKTPAEKYAKDNGVRLEVFKACTAVLNTIRDLQTPIRDKVVNDFWNTATEDQKADIRSIAKHHANPQASGMPFNQGIRPM